MTDKLIEAKIVLCKPGLLGLFLTFESGFTTCYEVGDLKEANEELARLSVNLNKAA